MWDNAVAYDPSARDGEEIDEGQEGGEGGEPFGDPIPSAFGDRD